MSNPYTFNFDPETGLRVDLNKQDIISETELAELMEQDDFDTDEYLRSRAEEVAEERLSDRQQAHRDCGMNESDFY